ncbi:hypothetical protein [Streptomyces inhibens]|uniref:hypothetical protein n=1 Tax=Streptomyces inhibens TaxID=2293571 RepID=UPI001EE6EF8C|nr:hypothetical protein [Streptomyces inhibens]UKY54820.1 hypothetical protein KI385_42625 [Streptomyces inhibens]
MVLAFAFSGGKDEGEPSGTPAKVPSVSSSAAATDLAERVTLTPKDWGSTFVRDSPYQSTGLTWPAVDQDCKVTQESPVGALAALSRNAKEPDGTAFSGSSFITYKGADFAKRGIARQREPLQRCPKMSDAGSKLQYDKVHEVAFAELKGFDDLVAEEGHISVDTDGKKADAEYTLLTGLKGQFLLQSYINRASGSQEKNRDDAVNALSLMLSRLKNS